MKSTMKGLLASITALFCVQVSGSFDILRKEAAESKHVHEPRMVSFSKVSGTVMPQITILELP